MLFLAFADIAALRSEPDLEKRSELALTNADQRVDAARQAYNAGDLKAEQTALEEIGESVAMCYDALEHARTAPAKSKYYKRAELRVHALIRRLNGFRDEVGADERHPVDAVIKQLSDVHDQLLSDIMSKKKK